MKRKPFFLFFLFLYNSVLLMPQDNIFEKEHVAAMNKILDSMYHTMSKCIYAMSNIDNSWEYLLPEIENEIDEIIYSVINIRDIFLEDDTAMIYTYILDMVINELEHVRRINQNIKLSEYGISQFFHSLNNVTNLCFLLIVIEEKNISY